MITKHALPLILIALHGLENLKATLQTRYHLEAPTVFLKVHSYSVLLVDEKGVQFS